MLSVVDVDRWFVLEGCRAPTLTYATSAVGSSGVVRAAVKAKGRVPS